MTEKRVDILIQTNVKGSEGLRNLESGIAGLGTTAGAAGAKTAGAAEQIGDAGILVDPKDDQQLALAIRALHDDSRLRATLIQRGKLRAAKFTSDDVAREMMNLFDEFAAIRRCWDGLYPECLRSIAPLNLV